MRGPTIRDVARHAGVSAATVSRVLNDSPLVLEPTRARVQAAVDELGYRLNATARNLSIGRAMAIGVVVPFFTAPSVIERLRGVVERLGRGERREYDLMLFDVEAPEQRDGALRDLARRDRVAGLLIISLPVSDAEVDALERDELPAVLVDADASAAPAGRDRQRPRRRARRRAPARARPSPDRVRRRPSRPTRTASRPARIAGSASSAALGAPACRARARAPRRRTGATRRRRSPRSCWRSRTRRARSSPPPTCRPSACSRPRSGAACACPEDLAVIGFDDVDLAEIVGLTTIRQPLREGGALAADLLLAAIERGARPSRRGAAGADGGRAPHDVIEAVLSAEGWPYASAPPVEPGDPGRFHALFGRDALITSLQLLPERPEIARATLHALAARQGRARRPAARSRRRARSGTSSATRRRRRSCGRAGRTRASSATTARPTRRRGSWSCWRRSRRVRAGGRRARAAAGWLADALDAGGGLVRHAPGTSAGRARPAGLARHDRRRRRRRRRRLRARRRLQSRAAAGRPRHAGGRVRGAAGARADDGDPAWTRRADALRALLSSASGRR